MIRQLPFDVSNLTIPMLITARVHHSDRNIETLHEAVINFDFSVQELSTLIFEIQVSPCFLFLYQPHLLGCEVILT